MGKNIIRGWSGNSKYIIYGLIDPRTEECRYIGRSSSGPRRPRRHGDQSCLEKDGTYKANWIADMKRCDIEYEILVLEEFSDQEELIDAERKWIKAAKDMGWRLTNLTDGGEGLLNPTQSTRDKIGEYSRKRMRTKEYQDRAIGDRRGKKLPEWWREKISIAGKGRKMSAETIAKVVAVHLGKKDGPLSEEWKRKISESSRGKSKSKAHCEKIGLGLKKSLRRKYRRGTVVLEFNGESKILQEWSEIYGIPHDTLSGRIRRGWSIERALSTPIDMRRRGRAKS